MKERIVQHIEVISLVVIMQFGHYVSKVLIVPMKSTNEDTNKM